MHVASTGTGLIHSMDSKNSKNILEHISHASDFVFASWCAGDESHSNAGLEMHIEETGTALVHSKGKIPNHILGYHSTFACESGFFDGRFFRRLEAAHHRCPRHPTLYRSLI